MTSLMRNYTIYIRVIIRIYIRVIRVIRVIRIIRIYMCDMRVYAHRLWGYTNNPNNPDSPSDLDWGVVCAYGHRLLCIQIPHQYLEQSGSIFGGLFLY